MNKTDQLAAVIAFHTLLNEHGRQELETPEKFWRNGEAVSPAEKREARRLARIIRASEILK